MSRVIVLQVEIIFVLCCEVFETLCTYVFHVVNLNDHGITAVLLWCCVCCTAVVSACFAETFTCVCDIILVDCPFPFVAASLVCQRIGHCTRGGGVYSRTLMPSGAIVHKVKIHFFLYFFVRPSFGWQFVIRVEGCCANCVVALAFLPSRHDTKTTSLWHP